MWKSYALICLLLVCTIQLFSQADTLAVTKLIKGWHHAAAVADFDAYFRVMHKESIFIGTDATERWNKKQFMIYAKPHFERGVAWSFTPLVQNFIFSDDYKTVWFDELLNTQMKICRGSGILVLEDGRWWLKHYVLSMTIPNDKVKKVVDLKSSDEDNLIRSFK